MVAISLPTKIESIHQATVLLGLTELKRWIKYSDAGITIRQTQAVLQVALIRAKMCELLAAQRGDDKDRFFLVGLLSCLDCNSGYAIDKVLDQLPLSKEIAEAILFHTGKAGEVLQYTVDYRTLGVIVKHFLRPQSQTYRRHLP